MEIRHFSEAEKKPKSHRKGSQRRVQHKKQTRARKPQAKLPAPITAGCKLEDCRHYKIVMENLVNVSEAQKLCQKFINKIKKIKI